MVTPYIVLLLLFFCPAFCLVIGTPISATFYPAWRRQNLDISYHVHQVPPKSVFWEIQGDTGKTNLKKKETIGS